MEAAQPDKAIRVIQIIKLPEDLHSHGLLRFDEFALEEPDQFVAPARVQAVHSELDDRRIRQMAHTRSNSMIQFVSQVLPPSSEQACSHCAEFAVIFDQMKRQ